ncbi:hypothetical protein RFH42_13875 [Acinetobacter rudis]|uniref:hypothetical protein n=1 Tax=Acinetobacter rudis TaxID=632955 RepID=UPI00280DDBD4|nr:hypothetical protein [Acinetobacter rudis]MDQ8954037.1 hypothetical protein [Acinetobacter rudis]
MRILLIFILICFSNLAYSFDIYWRVPWELMEKSQIITNNDVIQQHLSEFGLKKIDVIYHNRMLTNGVVDPDKIKKIVDDSNKNPEIPISFDIELGDRFVPSTVIPTINQVIDLYKEYGGKAKIGIYATLPQQTYGGKNLDDETEKKYIQLNKQYESLAEKIDFISPSFYFYDDEDINLWKKSVDFNMKQSRVLAKKYNLKIYPYITNAFIKSKVDPITKGWLIKPLSDQQMFDTLEYIKSQGADGVILWNSSNVLEQDGKKPVIDLNSSWFYGIRKFNLPNNSISVN